MVVTAPRAPSTEVPTIPVEREFRQSTSSGCMGSARRGRRELALRELAPSSGDSELALRLLSLRPSSPVKVASEIAPDVTPRLESDEAALPAHGARPRRSTQARAPSRVPE
eukprot:3750712-Pleurochrysis_carterae.AAC.1